MPAPDFRAQHRTVRLPGFAHGGEPLLISEFGGIAFQQSTGWGYSVAADGAEFVRRYQSLIEALAASPAVTGWCYTQLTDVEQETNGLLTYDRKPKVDPAIIRRINTGGA